MTTSMPDNETEYYEVAQLIAGTAPPAWLIHAAETAIRLVADYVNSENVRAPKADINKRLKKLQLAAQLIVNELQDWDIKGSFDKIIIQNNEFSNNQGNEQMTIQQAQWLDKVLDQIINDTVIHRGASNSRLTPTTLNARDLAAVFVAGFWKKARNKSVPKNNKMAHKACEIIYAKARKTQPRLGETDVLTGWRAHIVIALADLKEDEMLGEASKRIGWRYVRSAFTDAFTAHPLF